MLFFNDVISFDLIHYIVYTRHIILCLPDTLYSIHMTHYIVSLLPLHRLHLNTPFRASRQRLPVGDGDDGEDEEHRDQRPVEDDRTHRHPQPAAAQYHGDDAHQADKPHDAGHAEVHTLYHYSYGCAEEAEREAARQQDDDLPVVHRPFHEAAFLLFHNACQIKFGSTFIIGAIDVK